MTIESRTYQPDAVGVSAISSMRFLAPEVQITAEQQTSLETWVEENHEDANAIGLALQSDAEFAGIFTILATDKELCAQMVPAIMSIIEAKLIPTSQADLIVEVPVTIEAAVTETVKKPSRWTNLHDKLAYSYASLDAGLTDESTLTTPVGRSWGKKTWAEVEQEVANDPRKRILFANRPELRIVITEPSRFDRFMATNKVADIVGKTVERPLDVLEAKSKQMNEFLDDSRPLQDITLDSAANVANAMIESFKRLRQYDEKFLAAICQLIEIMDLPEKYAQARKFENELTDVIANKIIATAANYDYRTRFDSVREIVKPTPKQAKAALVATATMSWFAIVVAGGEATPVEQAPVLKTEQLTANLVTQDKQPESVNPTPVFEPKPTSLRLPSQIFNSTNK